MLENWISGVGRTSWPFSLDGAKTKANDFLIAASLIKRAPLVPLLSLVLHLLVLF